MTWLNQDWLSFENMLSDFWKGSLIFSKGGVKNLPLSFQRRQIFKNSFHSLSGSDFLTWKKKFNSYIIVRCL